MYLYIIIMLHHVYICIHVVCIHCKIAYKILMHYMKYIDCCALLFGYIAFFIIYYYFCQIITIVDNISIFNDLNYNITVNMVNALNG